MAGFFSILRQNLRSKIGGTAEMKRYLDSLYQDMKQYNEENEGVIKTFDLDSVDVGDVNDLPLELRTVKYNMLERRCKIANVLNKYPELWEPIKYDIGWCYDQQSVWSEMISVFNEYKPYLDDLKLKINKLKAKTGLDVSLKDALDEKNVDLENAPTNTEEINELYYLNELYWDAIATIGDKQGDIVWRALPKVVKDKYVKFVNDKVIELFGGDAILTFFVENFEELYRDKDLQRNFIDRLEQRLNDGFFKNFGQSVKLDLLHDVDNRNSAFYSFDEDKVYFNTAYWSSDVNSLVGVMKHEIFGHYCNSCLANMGLYGGEMKQFINKYTCCTDKDIVSHSSFISSQNNVLHNLVVKSPLLHIEYQAQDVSLETIGKLEKIGYDCYYAVCPESLYVYSNSFEERTAFLLNKTKNIKRKIMAFRKRNGLLSTQEMLSNTR